MGEDIDTVNAARVSFGKTSELACVDRKLGLYEMKEGDQRLISYLGSHKHISPFGHSFARFHVKAPIFVARQLVKHKFLRWNEISGRYVEFGIDPETGEEMPTEEVFYIPEKFRRAAEDKKQGSSDEEVTHITWEEDDWEGSFEAGGTTRQVYLNHSEECLGLYQAAINNYVCPEQARMLLPANLMTEWWWSGSLDAFADMCKLRLKEDTQYESRLVAQDVDREMSKLFPHSWKALLS